MPLPVPARLLFLLLFGVVLLSTAAPSPVEGLPVAPRPDAVVPGARKVVHSWGKLRLTVKTGMHGLGHGHGHSAADASPGPSDDEVLIKAPRRFVPKPNSPTCPDGTDADHKGKCREYW